MCGIFGYVSFQNYDKTKKCMPTLINGLRRLEYRGYDSAGMYLAHKDLIIKSVGNIDKLVEEVISTEIKEEEEDMVGIAHTRWATHGKPLKCNTHPHVSDEDTREFVVVHNGIITNYQEIKLFLEEQDFVFTSDTDTEVIPKLCKYLYCTYKYENFFDLIKDVIDKIEGSFAILVVSKHYPSEIIATKSGSPLILGLNVDNHPHEYVIASDLNAIIEHTKCTIVLHGNDILHITKDGFTIRNSHELVSRQCDVLDIQLSHIMKGKYEYFMEKEIFEQVSSIQQTMNGRLGVDNDIIMGGILEHIQAIEYSTRLVFIANGTSYHACLAVRPLFEKVCRIPISVENSCDFVDRGVHVFPSDTCIFVSQSGETADSLVALKIAKKRRALCLGITNVVGSTIDRETLCGIHVNAGTEIGVASTKSYTSQIVCMILLAMLLSRDSLRHTSIRTDIIKCLRSIPLMIEEVLNHAESYKQIAESWMKEKNILFIGRSYNYATALEASLKLKEIAYIHCEGLIAGELKHGPLALIDDDILVVVIATGDEKMKSSIEQLISRNARVFIVTDNENLSYNTTNKIILPKVKHECIRPIIDIIPFQLISYYLALKKGYNVDQPRNLAKSVTVTD